MSSSLTTTSITNTIVSATISSSHGANTGWLSPSSILTKLFSGDPLTIAFAFIVTITLPILLHFYFFYTFFSKLGVSGSSIDGIPTFLLLGPSNSGKTSLVTTLQRRMIAISKSPDEDEKEKEDSPEITVNGNSHAVSTPSTRLSQTASTIGLLLSPGIPLGSNKYRSENDTEVTRATQTGTPYKLIDTPGHGKLRLEKALGVVSHLNTGLRGVVFMLDSAAIEGADSPVSKDTAQYLHDVLLALQRRPKTLKKAKTQDVSVLVAANKQDLFTALPANAIRERLQDDIERVRRNRRKGVSAVDAKDEDVDDEDAILAGGGEASFSFKMLEEDYGIVVEVLGGAVKGDDDGRGVKKWEEWIGDCL